MPDMPKVFVKKVSDSLFLVPNGDFEASYNSLAEVKAAHRGVELVIEGLPKQMVQSAEPLTPELQKELDKELAARGLQKPTRPQSIPPPTISSNVQVIYNRAQEILKRYEFALQYAAEEKQEYLKIEIKTLQDFIAEVFGGA